MGRYTTIELNEPEMDFAAGHFTIFSESDRESLHGHNYTVSLSLTTYIDHYEGLNFDYRIYKRRIKALCKELHQRTIIPTRSPHLVLEEDDTYHYVTFNGERMCFLKHDACLVPITNSTIEELSQWFIERLIEDRASLKDHKISRLLVKVFSSPGKSGSCEWVTE